MPKPLLVLKESGCVIHNNTSEGQTMSQTQTPQPQQRKNHGGKVLMIACAFPPTGGPGVQRSAKFAKYLPRFDWMPTVWASDQIESLPSDPTLLNDLSEEVTVHTQRVGGKIRAMRRMFRGAMNAREAEGFTGAASRFIKSIDWRMEVWQNSNSLPDDYIDWARRSVQPLLRLIEKESIDLIYSTFSPASNHWLALELKRQTALPWIADFRDLWTDDYRYRESSIRRRNAHCELEREIFEEADLVVGVTEKQTTLLSNHIPALRQKFVTITNGFDPDDFEKQEISVSSPHRFVISHVGRFDQWRTNEALFTAMKQFASSLGTDREHFLFRIVGHASKAVLKKIHETGLPYEFTGYQSHADAIQAMCSSDVLMLNVPSGPNSDSVIPAKLFEYLASQKPILVVGPEQGICEQIVQECDAGISVSFDATEIANALGTLYGAWKNKNPMTGSKAESLAPYERKSLTQRLAQHMDELVYGPAPSQTQPDPQREEKSVEACVT